MRGGFFLFLLSTVFDTGTACAEAFQRYATVVDVQPIVETIYVSVAHQVCDKPNSQKHLSRPLAATIGEDIREQQWAWQTQTSCTTVKETQPRERITAYQVTYRYRGYTKTTRLEYDPGERMAVNVRVSPLP